MERVRLLAPSTLDLASALLFAQELEAVDPADDVDVDCSSVDFLDSAGLRVLTLAYNRHVRAGSRLRVVAPSPVTDRLLELSDLKGRLTDG